MPPEPFAAISNVLADFKPDTSGLSLKLNRTVDHLSLREDLWSGDGVLIGASVTWIERHGPYLLNKRIYLFLLLAAFMVFAFFSKPLNPIFEYSDPLQLGPQTRHLAFPYLDTWHLITGALCLGLLGAAVHAWLRGRKLGRLEGLDRFRCVLFGIDGRIRTPFGVHQQGVALPVVSENRNAVRRLRWTMDDVQRFAVVSYGEHYAVRDDPRKASAWCVLLLLRDGQEIVLSTIGDRKRGNVQPIIASLEKAFLDVQAVRHGLDAG